MRKSLLAIALSLLSLPALAQTTTTPPNPALDMGNGYVVPGKDWVRVPPESEGYSSARMEVLRAFLKTHQTTAMMAISRGKVVFEYGDLSLVSKIASVRKSILDLLFAAEMQKGVKLDPYVSQTVVQLGLEDKVPFIEPEEHATLEQLLSSRSGIYIPNGNTDQDKYSPKRGSEYPGTHFFYNNWDFDAAGTAFEKITHKDIFDAMRDDLAIPIGMQDFDRARQKKNFAPVSVHPEFATYLSTRDMARLGLLALSKGNWAHKQIADGSFIEWSTYPTTHFDELNPTGMHAYGWTGRWGYGMLWWAWDAPVMPGNINDGPYRGAYSAMGSGGQYITVFPALDLVVAHKVNIDINESANISGTTYMTILDLLLDAKCNAQCK